MMRRIKGGSLLLQRCAAAVASQSQLIQSQPQALRWASSSSKASLQQVNGPNDNDRILVVGSGVAGSAAALIAAETYRIPVLQIFAGSEPTDCNSYWAQGGIIYRNYGENIEPRDSADLLAQDIHRAGAGLCDDDAVRKVSEEGPERVRQLLLNHFQESGPFASVPFDRNVSTGELDLCLEASHAAPRILYRADHTGKAITQHITAAAARHPLITQRGNTVVTDLIVSEGSDGSDNEKICLGAVTLDRTTGRQQDEIAFRGTVLALGGLGGIYQHSTNPAGFNALGSSVALATRAGVTTQDLEYVQFHPTALMIPNEARFLLSEALRGEGAILRTRDGRAFAKDYHPDGELAPRDVVARAVFNESQKLQNNGEHNVFLDITHRDAAWLHDRFPSIQAHLAGRGLDLAKDRLPITPAAHYTCGGVATDLQGRTSLANLYAAGEAARTGLHGGNRLASTSLLEGLVFGAAVSDYLGSVEGQALSQQAAHAAAVGVARSSTRVPVVEANGAARDDATALLEEIRRIMWDCVGVVRTKGSLESAAEQLLDHCEQANNLHATGPSFETVAVRDAASAGHAVALAALANPVSKGAHCILEPAEENHSDEEEVASL